MSMLRNNSLEILHIIYNELEYWK